jgi:hypothetical protein
MSFHRHQFFLILTVLILKGTSSDMQTTVYLMLDDKQRILTVLVLAGIKPLYLLVFGTDATKAYQSASLTSSMMSFLGTQMNCIPVIFPHST